MHQICILYFYYKKYYKLTTKQERYIIKYDKQNNKNLSDMKFQEEILKLTGNTMSHVITVVWLGESGGGELVNENLVGGVRLLIDTGDKILGLWLGVPCEP